MNIPFSVLDLVALLGVSRIRIEYAERKGYLPMPKRWRNRKIYDQSDIETIRLYFAKHKNRKGKVKE